jgi:hypothetical protein
MSDEMPVCPGCRAKITVVPRDGGGGPAGTGLRASHADECPRARDMIWRMVFPSDTSWQTALLEWLAGGAVGAVDECVRQGEREEREVGLLVVRGLPGSGKSTLGREWMEREGGEGWLHYEPDHLFRDCGGRYRWDAQLWRQAEWFTRAMVDRALARGERVVVTDVLATVAEVAGYVELAKAHGATFRVVCSRRRFGSVHRVPVYVVERMREAWEDWEGEEVVE